MILSLSSVKHLYDGSDPVHGFSHIERVYRLCDHIGRAEGAEMEILLTAALLHDVAGADEDSERRENHHRHSADFADTWLAEIGWLPERIAAVSHCIRAHRYRDETESPAMLEAKVLFDADKLDSIGAVGVARAIAYAALQGNPFYAVPSAQFLADGNHAPGEVHSAYHEYLFKLRRIHQRLLTPTGQALAWQRHSAMADYFERLSQEVNGEL
ncbi:MAG: HD domain-containing protein [Anaerolineae bacterium]|nr:HD domain-containing protein [Anaerolineae bacterium]